MSAQTGQVLEASLLVSWPWDLILSGNTSTSSEGFNFVQIACSVSSSIAVVSNETIFHYIDGVTETYSLPPINSKLTASKYDQRLILGYDSGVLLFHGLDGNEPVRHQFHKTAVKRIHVSDNGLWVLYSDSVVAFVKNFERLMGVPPELVYPLVQKFRLAGGVHDIAPCDDGDSMVAIGSAPMIRDYKRLSRYEGDLIIDELDTMRIKAKQTAARMGTAVTSFARNIWGRSASDTSVGTEPGSLAAEKRTVRIVEEFHMDDDERTLSYGSISPSRRYLLAVDQFNGRIFQYDTLAGLFVGLWKGYRGAECAFTDDSTAIFTAPKQGFIEVKELKSSKRIAKLDLHEAIPDWKAMRLLSPTKLAVSTATALCIYAISIV